MKHASEFELINAFLAELPHPPTPKGPGDDAAVLPASRANLCVTTDTVVENVHFSRPFFSLADIGHKALAVNLSDLAAMGARPTWWLCSLGLPKRFTRAQVRSLAGGMEPLAKRYRLALVGGNITASPVLSLTLTLAGEARHPMLRSGARAGDLLFVSGTLGAAAAGLSLRIPALVAAQKRPQPQVALGLAVARFASAAIDVSDGLLADLGHLCEASSVGADLHTSTIPIHSALRHSPHAVEWALRGGEDYQLLVTVPPRHAGRLKSPFTCLGQMVRNRRLTLDGKPIRTSGFDHFKSPAVNRGR